MGAAPTGSFFGSRTPLDSVGAQCTLMSAVWRGLEAKHLLELMRTPEEAPSGPDLKNKFFCSWTCAVRAAEWEEGGQKLVEGVLGPLDLNL